MKNLKNLKNLKKFKKIRDIKDMQNMSLSFVFLFLLSLPVLVVFFNAFGLISLVFFGLLPLGWFILDSEISHYDMDKYMHEM